MKKLKDILQKIKSDKRLLALSVGVVVTVITVVIVGIVVFVVAMNKDDDSKGDDTSQEENIDNGITSYPVSYNKSSSSSSSSSKSVASYPIQGGVVSYTVPSTARVEFFVDGVSSRYTVYEEKELTVDIVVVGTDKSKCTVDLESNNQKTIITSFPYKAVFKNGDYTMRPHCNIPISWSSDMNLYVYANEAAFCKTFSFKDPSPAEQTFEELNQRIIGKWQGCSAAPGNPAGKVDFELKDDGTYASKSYENHLGDPITALHYGTDGNGQQRRYTIRDILDDKTAVGEIDFLGTNGEFWGKGKLSKIILNGDQLYIEVYRDNYGPVILRLYREQ